MAKTKKLKYKAERETIIKNIFECFDLNEKNRLILFRDFEENNQFIDYIKRTEDSIRSVFSCGSWVYFISSNKNKSYISLIKNILKDMDIIFNIVYIMEDNNKKIRFKGIYIETIPEYI